MFLRNQAFKFKCHLETAQKPFKKLVNVWTSSGSPNSHVWSRRYWDTFWKGQSWYFGWLDSFNFWGVLFGMVEKNKKMALSLDMQNPPKTWWGSVFGTLKSLLRRCLGVLWHRSSPGMTGCLGCFGIGLDFMNNSWGSIVFNGLWLPGKEVSSGFWYFRKGETNRGIKIWAYFMYLAMAL